MSAADILKDFIALNEEKHSEDNEKILLSAYELIKKELIESNYSINHVRLAHKIYGYLGDKGLSERIEAVRRYLNSDNQKTLEDQHWANWELVDNLALLRQYKQMIEEQKLFLAWTKKNMTSEYLLTVMYDSTQANGWIHEGQSEEWFKIYYELINCIEPTETNRHDRVIYVETAAGLLIYHLNKYTEAVDELQRYSNFINEDVSWSEHISFFIRLKSYYLGLYSAQCDLLNYEKTLNETILEMINNINKHNSNESVAMDDICDMAHEIGTCLMWEKRYKQAMPLFEYALQNQGTGITHFFYAICNWASSRSKSTALEHLRLAEVKVKGNGGLRSRYKQMFLEQEEFADVWEDEEFLSVFVT